MVDVWGGSWGTSWGSSWAESVLVISAVVSGTVSDGVTEAELVAGGQTLIITLTNDTWVADGATFDAQRQAIIDGLNSAGIEVTGWNAEIRDKEVVGSVARTSSTVVTTTLTASPAYDITADETITVTVPASALTAAGAIIATPTFDATFTAQLWTDATDQPTTWSDQGPTVTLEITADYSATAGLFANATDTDIVGGRKVIVDIHYRAVNRFDISTLPANVDVRQVDYEVTIDGLFIDVSSFTWNIGPYDGDGQGDPEADGISFGGTAFAKSDVSTDNYIAGTTEFRSTGTKTFSNLGAEADLEAANAAGDIFTLALDDTVQGVGNTGSIALLGEDGTSPPKLTITYIPSLWTDATDNATTWT